MELAEGYVLADRYRIVRLVGRGGVGVVYQAIHVLTNRTLAIKVLRDGLEQDGPAVARFMNEARACATIGDPHVVEIVDLGRMSRGASPTAPRAMYIAMEFLEGTELTEAMEREPRMHPGRAAHIAAQIARAMGKAHSLGILHRDLKPSNLFLVERDGEPDYVKVLDFGIAKLLTVDGEPGMPGLTKTGEVVGTPRYMPPEQLRGTRDVDARADVYAIGAVLYEMLAGRPPVEGATANEIFFRHMTAAIDDVRTLRPELPEDFAAIIMRSLAREPQARFASGAELAQALEPYASSWRRGERSLPPSEGGDSLPAGGHDRSRWLVMGVTVASLLLVSVLLALFTR